MAGLEVVFGKGGITVTIEGKEYKASPLRVKDFAAFRAWIRDSKLESFMRAAKMAELDGESFSKGIDSILSTPMRVGRDEKTGQVIADDPVLSEMFTEAGLSYLLWLSIKKKHPKVELDIIDIGYEELVKLVEVVTKLTGLEVPKEEEGPSQGSNPP